jgi:acyl-CoA thioester hydrolase
VRAPPGTRAAYGWFMPIQTRWMDNDIYGHVNNVNYYSWFDTAVARFLLDHGISELTDSPEIGLVVETQCRYFAPVAFPDALTCGLRVARIGTTSIRYELGLFREDAEAASAEAHFVHVYVDRATQRRAVPLPAALRHLAARFLT